MFELTIKVEDKTTGVEVGMIDIIKVFAPTARQIAGHGYKAQLNITIETGDKRLELEMSNAGIRMYPIPALEAIGDQSDLFVQSSDKLNIELKVSEFSSMSELEDYAGSETLGNVVKDLRAACGHTSEDDESYGIGVSEVSK